MLGLTTAKRLTGLALPLVIGGSVLAVRAASATGGTAAAAAGCTTTTAAASTTAGGSTTTVGGSTTTAGGSTTTATLLPTTTTACDTTTTSANCPTSTTSGSTTTSGVTLPGSTTTTGGSTTTTSGSTTTTGGSTTTTSGGITLPITLSTTTTTAGSTTTTAGGSTTTSVGGTTTTHGSTTTSAGGSTTTVCPTTTTSGQGAALRITSVTTDNVAGHPLTINGTAKSGLVVTVHGNDPKHGKRVLGQATSSHLQWHLHLKRGVLYNTVVRATGGGAKSNRETIDVAQVLRITGRGGHCHYSSGKHCAITFLGETAAGFQYRLKGSSASKVPHEKITVRRHGHVLGSARMHKDGTYTITFTIKSGRSKALVLFGSGLARNGDQYTLAGHRRFHVA